MFTVEVEQIRYMSYLVFMGECWTENRPDVLEAIYTLLILDANEISR